MLNLETGTAWSWEVGFMSSRNVTLKDAEYSAVAFSTRQTGSTSIQRRSVKWVPR